MKNSNEPIYVIDANDKVQKVTDLDAAIKQAEEMSSFEINNSDLFEVKQKAYWQNLLKKLNELKKK